MPTLSIGRVSVESFSVRSTSRATTAASPWSVWPWVRMRAGPARLAPASRMAACRTKLAAAAACGLLLPLLSCSRTEPAQQAYARGWAASVAGDPEAAGREASSYTTRAPKEPDSYWVWSLKLLDAEVLNAQSKWSRARDLLQS